MTLLITWAKLVSCTSRKPVGSLLSLMFVSLAMNTRLPAPSRSFPEKAYRAWTASFQPDPALEGESNSHLQGMAVRAGTFLWCVCLMMVHSTIEHTPNQAR